MRFRYEKVFHINLKSSFKKNLILKYKFVEKFKFRLNNEQFASLLK